VATLLRALNLDHDGGSTQVEVETDISGEDSCAVIRFGASYTLRINGENMNKLHDLFSEVNKDLAIGHTYRTKVSRR
jgi:hypothetical protein